MDLNQGFALFLTHRQGAVVGVFAPTSQNGDDAARQKEDVSELQNCAFIHQTLADWVFRSVTEAGLNVAGPKSGVEIFKSVFQNGLNHQQFAELVFALNTCFLGSEVPEVFAPQNLAPKNPCTLSIVMSHDGTAENLWSLYRRACEETGVTDRDVRSLLIGAGPVGSFTGLRLGASFVGGLVHGRTREVFGLPTFSLGFLKSLPSSSPAGLDLEKQNWESFLSERSDFSSSVLGIEVLLCFCLARCGLAFPVQVDQLNYAAEPGPVRALKQKQLVK